MYLEEVLPEHRAGREVRRKSTGITLSELFMGDCMTLTDLDADDWELVIDLVQYADGYEFETDTENWFCQLTGSGKYIPNYYNWNLILGAVYMTKDAADELANKLNSGEWVLK